MDSPRRRRLLEATATAIATGAAGCLSTSGDGSDTEQPTDDSLGDGDVDVDGGDGDASATSTDGSTDATASLDGEFALDAWLPAPAAVGVEGYLAYYGDLDAVRSVDVSETGRERVRRLFVPVSLEVLDYQEVTAFTGAGQTAGVCAFDADVTDVESRLADAALADDQIATPTAGPGTVSSDDGTATGTGSDPTVAPDDETATGGERPVDDAGSVPAPDGYAGYRTEAGLYWLAADHVVFGADEGVLQAFVDAHRGDVDRYASNEDFAAVRNATGEVDLGAGRAAAQSAVSGTEAFAYGWTFDDPVSMTAAFAFPDAASTNAEGVDALTDRPGFAEYDQRTVTTDGRVVSLTGAISPGEFDLFAPDDDGEDGAGTARAPQVSFAFEFAQGKDGEWDGDEGERIVIQHQGGDTVALANVALHYDDTAVATMDGIASTKPDDDSWAAGGEWTLRAASDDAPFDSGATLTVVWTSDDGESAAVIGRTELP